MSNSTLGQLFLFSKPLLWQLYIFPGCEWFQHAQFSCVSSYSHFFCFGPAICMTGSEWFYMGPSCVFPNIPSTNLVLLAWQRVSMLADSALFAFVICLLTLCHIGLIACEWFHADITAMSLLMIISLCLILLAWQNVSVPMWSHSLSAHSDPIALAVSEWFYATRSSNVSSQHSFIHSNPNGFIVG